MTLVGCGQSAAPQVTPDATGGDPVDAAVDAPPDAPPAPPPCAEVDTVFVSSVFGTDGASGQKGDPLKTISAGITKANGSTFKKCVMVAGGTYNEHVTMASGVHVYGGFDRNKDWQRSSTTPTIISFASESGHVVLLDALNDRTILDGVQVVAADASAQSPGLSSVGIAVVNSADVVLDSVRVTAGKGADGARGQDAGPGLNGYEGAPGDPAIAASSTRPKGGVGGYMWENCTGPYTAPSGGKGGRPSDGSTPAERGDAAYDAFQAAGGAPGLATSAQGQPGQNGANGSNGAPGVGGEDFGSIYFAVYQPANGGFGTNGSRAYGGGGGGGGGMGVNTSNVFFWGNAGGGGGGAGCGGFAGAGGVGGGASIGVLVVSSKVTVSSSQVTTSTGGKGGAAGTGGNGGVGGLGGKGGDAGMGSGMKYAAGKGGNGGNGGTGGKGGNGGGGGGGPSVPVVCAGTVALVSSQNMLTPGAGGQGGGSTDNSGKTGRSATSVGCPTDL